jgi:2-oxoglutarate dehydrogenase E2 component (dihydrolipoamide succinyltransferase)
VQQIIVPKVNSNDATYVLLEWLAAEGTLVTAGQPVASLETSKAIEELPSPADGYLGSLRAAGGECQPGDVIGHVLATADERVSHPEKQQPGDEDADGLVLTRAAQALAAASGLSHADLRALGKKVIRAEDLMDHQPGGPGPAVSRQQQAIAARVSESHRSIPATFAVVKVWADAALDELRQPAAQGFAGLPELIVKAIGSARTEFPLFFSASTEDGGLRDVSGAHVGVTIDLGKGLFVPVVRDADRKSAADIAADLMAFRVKTMRSAFREEDFVGSNIMLSLGMEPGVVISHPVIYPGHLVAVAAGGLQQELNLSDGDLKVLRYFYLCASYDHRFINGRDATRFLLALKSRLEHHPG